MKYTLVNVRGMAHEVIQKLERGQFRSFGSFSSLEEAQRARVVSGDIVIHSDSGEVVTEPAWLWPWEKNNAESYAQKCVNEQILHNQRVA